MNYKRFIKVTRVIGWAVLGIFLLHRSDLIKLSIDSEVYLYLAIIYLIFGLIDYLIMEYKDGK